MRRDRSRRPARAGRSVVCATKPPRGTVEPVQFFAASRLVMVAGKGGVGKTTVTAAMARAAARLGLRVLVVDVEAKSGLAGMLGLPNELSYEEIVAAAGLGHDGKGEVTARSLTPAQALLDYLD